MISLTCPQVSPYQLLQVHYYYYYYYYTLTTTTHTYTHTTILISLTCPQVSLSPAPPCSLLLLAPNNPGAETVQYRPSLQITT